MISGAFLSLPAGRGRVPTYKEEYEDGFGCRHVTIGKPPQALGAWWLRFYCCRREPILLYDVIRAK
jgi:hypothetical protein